jgi:hypothetical protein
MNLDFRCRTFLDGAEGFERAVRGNHVCADCRYAQIFAAQPGAFCTRPGRESAGTVHCAVQPACEHFVIHPAQDVALSEFEAAQHAKPTPHIV